MNTCIYFKNEYFVTDSKVAAVTDRFCLLPCGRSMTALTPFTQGNSEVQFHDVFFSWSLIITHSDLPQAAIKPLVKSQLHIDCESYLLLAQITSIFHESEIDTVQLKHLKSIN